jgi:hypothetical protein
VSYATGSLSSADTSSYAGGLGRCKPGRAGPSVGRLR